MICRVAFQAVDFFLKAKVEHGAGSLVDAVGRYRGAPVGDLVHDPFDVAPFHVTGLHIADCRQHVQNQEPFLLAHRSFLIPALQGEEIGGEGFHDGGLPLCPRLGCRVVSLGNFA